MSVLLDALKKAAEEKKKKAGEATEGVVSSEKKDNIKKPVLDEKTENVSSNVQVEPPSPVAKNELKNEVEEAPVSLKFNFDVKPSQTESDQSKTTTMEDNDVSPPAPLASKELEQDSALTTSINKNFDKATFVEELEKKASDAETDNSQAEPAFRIKQSVQEPKSFASDDLETRLAMMDETPAETVAPAEVSQVDIKSKEESLLALTEAEHKASEQDKEKKAVEGTKEKNSSLQGANDGNDWSLEQIPGYQNYNTTHSQQEKARVILPHFSQKKKHTPNRWRLYAMSSILIAAGFSYYAMFYFEKQSSKVDSDLQRYQAMNQPRALSIEPKEDKVVDKSADHKANDKLKEKEEVAKTSEPVNAKPAESKKQPTATKVAKLSEQVKEKSVRPRAEKPSMVTPTKPSNLKIASRAQISKVSIAYKAYQAGDWQKAKSFYQQAYEEEPKNIATLFGLGAVSVHQGEKNKALAYYQKILKLEPNNELAQKAILSIKSSETVGKETLEELKKLVEINPEDSAAAFALGNVYAKRKDWVAAQEYYFKAYQHQPNQSIYALNLAVSLDQLGEYRLAKQYYQEALAKSSPNSATFDLGSVKKRVLVLNQFLDKEK